jgi:hypothetical protein
MSPDKGHTGFVCEPPPTRNFGVRYERPVDPLVGISFLRDRNRYRDRNRRCRPLVPLELSSLFRRDGLASRPSGPVHPFVYDFPSCQAPCRQPAHLESPNTQARSHEQFRRNAFDQPQPSSVPFSDIERYRLTGRSHCSRASRCTPFSLSAFS